MDHYKFVITEHLNHYGSLYGGTLLKWIDEVGYITANVHYPNNRFVTISLDNVEFRHRIAVGTILRFSVQERHFGTTSVGYHVEVYDAVVDKSTAKVLFETNITFVNIGADGNKKSIFR
jgi:acyl-CoA hydrolase